MKIFQAEGAFWTVKEHQVLHKSIILVVTSKEPLRQQPFLLISLVSKFLLSKLRDYKKDIMAIIGTLLVKIRMPINQRMSNQQRIFKEEFKKL